MKILRGEEVVGAKVLPIHWTSRLVAEQSIAAEREGVNGLLMRCRLDTRQLRNGYDDLGSQSPT